MEDKEHNEPEEDKHKPENPQTDHKKISRLTDDSFSYVTYVTYIKKLTLKVPYLHNIKANHRFYQDLDMEFKDGSYPAQWDLLAGRIRQRTRFTSWFLYISDFTLTWSHQVFNWFSWTWKVPTAHQPYICNHKPIEEPPGPIWCCVYNTPFIMAVHGQGRATLQYQGLNSSLIILTLGSHMGLESQSSVGKSCVTAQPTTSRLGVLLALYTTALEERYLKHWG